MSQITDNIQIVISNLENLQDMIETGEVLRFGFATDIHYADRDTVDTRYYRDGLPKLVDAVSHWKSKNVGMVLLNGDIIDHYTSTEPQALIDLGKIKEALNGMDAHFVLGNHDQDKLTKSQISSVTHKTAGHYSFDKNGIHFIILDANYSSDDNNAHYGAGGFAWNVNYIPPAERTWLAADLAATTLPTLVFCHYRLDEAGDYSVSNRTAIRTILENSGKVKAVFAGHNHINETNTINGIKYITMMAMTEGAHPTNAFSTVHILSSNTMNVTGTGQQNSHTAQIGVDEQPPPEPDLLLEGLLLNFEPESFINTSGKASAWNDLGPNAYHATQATAANRPTIIANDLNGHASIEFFGNQWLARADTPDMAQPCTIVAVVKATDGGTRDIISSNNTSLPILAVSGASTSDGVYMNGAVASDIGAISAVGNWKVIISTYNGALSQRYVDGVADHPVVNIGSAAFDGIMIGRQSNVTTNMFVGKMVHLRAYSSMSTEKRSALATYIFNKYGI
jgi:predicted phosphodiesterase